MERKELSSSQAAALAFVSDYAIKRKEEARQTIEEILQMSDIDRDVYEDAIALMKSRARIAMHFHPDRLDPADRSVAEALLQQGVYKSQFETLLSNGSVSAYPGGQRDVWEERLFGGAYQQEGVTNRDRPKYGALDLMLHADGPAPRFGSCYFLLKPEVSHRSTYTYLDSHQNPIERGTYAEFDDIMAALLQEVFLRDSALGERDLRPKRLIQHLHYSLLESYIDPSTRAPNRNLNHYIEAQVHGEIDLENDVDVLVTDPSFLGTPIERILKQICAQYSIDIYWHQGFALPVNEVPVDFRGPAMPSLARRIGGDGYIDAHKIGAAAMELKRHPDAWQDRGTYSEVLQEFKLLWHVLVKYGKPVREMQW